jgi:hypothetical protein
MPYHTLGDQLGFVYLEQWKERKGLKPVWQTLLGLIRSGS